MHEANITMRERSAVLPSRMRGLRLMMCAIAATNVSGHAAAHHLSADRSAITQAVLDGARARWRGPLPCVSDHLMSATSDRDTPQRISRSSGVKSPFTICRSVRLGDRYLAISLPTIKGDAAAVSLDYRCPVCGWGDVYWLKNKNGRWHIIGRERILVS